MRSLLIASFTLLFLVIVKTGHSQNYSSIKELIASGKEDEAISVLNTVEDKNNIYYLNLFGEAQMRKGLYEEALENFAKAEYLQEHNQDHDVLQLSDT